MIRISETVDLFEIKTYLGMRTMKILSLLKSLNKNNGWNDREMLIKQAFAAFYETDTLRKELSIEQFEFRDVEIAKQYEIALKELKHWVAYNGRMTDYGKFEFLKEPEINPK